MARNLHMEYIIRGRKRKTGPPANGRSPDRNELQPASYTEYVEAAVVPPSPVQLEWKKRPLSQSRLS